MIYDGLEFGAFMEIPSDSPCYALLRGVNPVLHAVFVFFQMYFVFVSARVSRSPERNYHSEMSYLNSIVFRSSTFTNSKPSPVSD